MTAHRWAPVLVPLAEWIDPSEGSADAAAIERLELRDARLTEARCLLSGADELIKGTTARHRPAASGPAAAVELDLLADRLAALDLAGLEEHEVLLRRAAVLCAGDDWSRLAALSPALRMRIAAVSEAIADTAVQIRRLRRGSRHQLGIAPSPEVAAFAEEEAALEDELRRRTAKVGADSAYAAADGAFLPSLSDFLR